MAARSILRMRSKIFIRGGRLRLLRNSRDTRADRIGVKDSPRDVLDDPRAEDRRWRGARRAAEEARARVERAWCQQPTAPQGIRATDIRKAQWLAAIRWRNQIRAVCVGEGLAFPQWLVLDSIRQLIEETKDAVIQAQISARLELDESRVSEITRQLDAKGLVNRGEDIMGKAWRVILTQKAKRLLGELEARIELASTVR